jgi:hypothetical protein
MVDDELFDPDPAKRIGFVSITGRDITDLGGTRLLREIGFRLVRRGHLPLLLGQYDENMAPKSLREVVCEILDHALVALELLRREPIQFTVFDADPEFAAPPDDASIIELQDHVIAFRDRSAELDPDRVRRRLADDFAALTIFNFEGYRRGLRSRPGLARKPSRRPGRYCICRSRVLTSLVS